MVSDGRIPANSASVLVKVDIRLFLSMQALGNISVHVSHFFMGPVIKIGCYDLLIKCGYGPDMTKSLLTVTLNLSSNKEK